jgi:two-component system LytT family response regulator
MNTGRRHAWRALIVDDEPLARRTLRLLLEALPDAEIVGECDNGEAAVAAIRETRPEVVFLDVEMPGVDGLGVLGAVGLSAIPVVVFVTAYDRYAVRAFEAHALDYLLKPFSDERFAAVVARVGEKLRHQTLNEMAGRLTAWLAERTEEAAAPRQQLVVRDGGQTFVLPWSDITWIEAQDYCVRIHAGRQRPVVRQSIRSVLGQLDPGAFVRIHRSAAVNVAQVRQVRPLSSGDAEVLLADGTVVRMSRTYRAGFETAFGKRVVDRV